jgi:hypothetical protein
MKKLLLISLIFSMASVAVGEVSTRVSMADGNTPLELADPNVPLVYRDIMAGTQLTIILDSNLAAENWHCALAIADVNRDYGVLSARGPGPDHPNSCLPAAGLYPAVNTWLQTGIAGYNMYSGVEDFSVGDWFIIDYNATSVGYCTVEFYENFVPDPNRDLHFTHVVTRDFNNDGIVNFVDFDLFASYWDAADCNGPGWCQGADLDNTGSVDGYDLELFVDFWVERTHVSWFW